MNNKTRIIVNTLVQNARSIINIVLSLYSTRIVMDALGHSDYGIYMLVAGVVSLLNFFTNSLTLTTQRHISFCHGAGKKEEAKAYFANSYLLLLIIGVTLSTILVSLTSIIFESGFILVEANKMEEAKYVYLLVITSVLMTLMTAPFKALLISYENIVYISIIEIIDGILKLAAVFILYYISEYRLTVYAFIIMSVMLFNLLAFMIYCKGHYPETCILPAFKKWNKEIQKKIVGFATWSLYGMACIIFRTQGTAVLINHLVKGTILNTSFGIATQIQGSVSFFSSAIHNSIKPQIIKAEGAGNHDLAVSLSEKSCKFGFLILTIVVIPIIIELPIILDIWLKEIPPLCIFFCTIILCTALIDQLSLGMTLIVSAIGRNRNFSLINFTIKTLAIPAMYIGVKNGLTIAQAFVFYGVFELISSFATIIYICKAMQVSLTSYLKNVFARTVPIALILGIAGYGSHILFEVSPFRILITGSITTIVGIVAIWFIALHSNEKTYILQVIRNKFKAK